MRIAIIAANAGAIAAGLALGQALRADSASMPEPSTDIAEEAEAHAKAAMTEEHAEPSSKPDGHEGYEVADDPAMSGFAFRRPFIVPIAEGWRTQALVVVNVELDLPPADEDAAGRILETRLRDAILPALMVHGEEGGFADMPMDEAVVAGVVAAAAADVLSDIPAVTVKSLDKRPV